jgi:hypothetical protein
MTTPVRAAHAHTPRVNSPENTKNFLKKCVEDLKPEKLAKCQNEANKWHAISIISGVAFFALAIATMVTVGFIAPAFTSMVALSAIILAIPAAGKVAEYHERYKVAKSEADGYQALQRHHANLANKRPARLRDTLRNMGIDGSRVPDNQITQLIPLISRAKFLEEQTDKFTQKKDQELSAARALTGSTEAKKVEQAVKYGFALHYEDQALHLKVKNAFVNAVLRNPKFKGNLDNLGSLSDMGAGFRAVAHELKEPNANNIFTFKNRRLAPITYDQVRTTSVANLGHRLLAAMRT